MVIDIGGGSTEVALGDSAGAAYLESLRLGAIRLSGEFPEVLGERPVPGRVYDDMRRRVQLESVRVRRDLAGRPVDVAYGTSGTIRNLASVVVRALGRHPTARGHRDPRRARKVGKLLRGLDLEERRRVPGLNPLRADIVVAGAAILDAVMEDLGLGKIRAVAECGLREGLVVDHLARAASPGAPDVHGAREERAAARARLLLRRGSRASRDVAGAGALRLVRRRRLHRYGAEERELFGYAALLHDVGTFLSYTDHHLHSYYLIRHADLVGFDEIEVAVMAATALSTASRGPAPGTRRSRGSTGRARARAPDERPAAPGRVPGPRSRRRRGPRRASADGPGALVIEVRARADWHLERWRLENRREALEKALRAASRSARWRAEGELARRPAVPRGTAGAQISAITVASSRLNSLPATVGHTSGKVSTSRSISS